jgi:hypothetical protein
MVVHVIDTTSRTHPMLLFSHLKIYIWLPLIYIYFDRHGLYPVFEKAGISPDSVLKHPGVHRVLQDQVLPKN